jgi:hypothetical protein
MKSMFWRRDGADPVRLAEELPGVGKSLALDDRADCCPARPVVTVVLAPSPGRPAPADLRLCGHHYRASCAALRAAGAAVYDAGGMRIAPHGDDQRLAAQPEPLGSPEIPAQHPTPNPGR